VRVVHVYKDIYPPVLGGVERSIDALRSALPDVTSDVLVCAREPRTSVRTGRHGRETRVAELGRVLSVPLAPTFPRWLARQPADVVHLHMPNPTGELAALWSANGTPLLVSYHADVVRQAALLPVYRHLVARALRRASRIVVAGARVAATSDPLRPFADKVTVVPFGIDVSRFDPAAVPGERRRALRERLGSPLVVAVGRCVHYKGFEILIDAARGLDATVVIIGDGPRLPALRRRAARLPRVHLPGLLGDEELIAHLAAADCFVLPSVNRAESFGIATIEAQAMGLPAVVCDVGTSTVEAIEPGATGLVVPPGDPRALAEALRALLADPPRRKAMGRAARDRVLARHDARALASRWTALYAEVAASSRTAC
jgi:glycosyltransferase involved in cell wall biosynthesis